MTTQKHRLLLGAHMSIAGGIEESIERGASIGCTTIQIFTKSNRQWRMNPLKQQEIDAFKKNATHYNIYPIVAHATYLINIASANKNTELASINALSQELLRCDQLEIPYLVLHPGSASNASPEECFKRLLENLDKILETTPSNTMLLLENMAGQGAALASTLDQLATILHKSAYKKRLGICLDTCHAFVAGYDLRTEKPYEQFWLDFDNSIGLEHLKVIHCNDSKKDLGSRIDRHEHIGKGKLGLATFEMLFNDKRFFEIPKILETPKITQEPFAEDMMNMETIYKLLWPETKKILGIKD